MYMARLRVFLFLMFSLLVINSEAQEVKLGLPIGHSKRVNMVEFSPDERHIVSASDHQTAILWDAQTGKLFYRLVGHSGTCRSYKAFRCMV